MRRSLIYVYVTSYLFAILTFFVSSFFSADFIARKDYFLAIIGIYTWIPGFFAFYFLKKENYQLKWKNPFGSKFLIAVLLPVILIALGISFCSIFGGFSLENLVKVCDHYHLHTGSRVVDSLMICFILYFVSLCVSVSINYLLILGEELFWRGYLWEKLREYGCEKGGTILAFLYSLWLFPIVIFLGYQYPDHRVLGLFMTVLFSYFLTPIYLYLREKEKGIQSVTVFHAMMNTFGPIMVVFFPDKGGIICGPVGIFSLIATGIVGGMIFYLFKRNKAGAAYS